MKKLLTAMLTAGLLAFGATAASAETVTFDLGNRTAYVDAGHTYMERAAGVNEKGDILVPVRDVAELFGGTVEYHAEERMISMWFKNGNWALIFIGEEADEDGGALFVDEKGRIVSVGTFKDGHLYLPASLMAMCIGGKVEFVDYGQDSVYRLIYHVR